MAPLSYDLQSAAYQLGCLKCYGDKDVEIATSCAALKKKGIMTSGYYNIKPEGNTHTKLVFCDMKSGSYTNVPQVKSLLQRVCMTMRLYQVVSRSQCCPRATLEIIC